MKNFQLIILALISASCAPILPQVSEPTLNLEVELSGPDSRVLSGSVNSVKVRVLDSNKAPVDLNGGSYVTDDEWATLTYDSVAAKWKGTLALADGNYTFAARAMEDSTFAFAGVVTQNIGASTNTVAITCAAVPAITIDGLTPESGWTGWTLGSEAANDYDTGAPTSEEIDIRSISVTNNATNLYVGVKLKDAVANWPKLLLFFHTGATGRKDNPWARTNIQYDAGSSKAASYFIGSWLDSTDGGHQFYSATTGVWVEATPSPATFARGLTAGFVEYAIPLSNLGLSAGQIVDIRVVTTGGGATDTATDVAPVDDTGANKERGDGWAGASALFKTANVAGMYTVR